MTWADLCKVAQGRLGGRFGLLEELVSPEVVGLVVCLGAVEVPAESGSGAEASVIGVWFC